MFFRMVYKSGQIFLPFCHNPRVWQTDRQTDGQTEISSLYRVCITCSAVKTRRVTWCAFLHIWGAKGGNRIVMKFCMRVAVLDVGLITRANFGDDQFRGFW